MYGYRNNDAAFIVTERVLVIGLDGVKTEVGKRVWSTNDALDIKSKFAALSGLGEKQDDLVDTYEVTGHTELQTMVQISRYVPVSWVRENFPGEAEHDYPENVKTYFFLVD